MCNVLCAHREVADLSGFQTLEAQKDVSKKKYDYHRWRFSGTILPGNMNGFDINNKASSFKHA